MATVPLVDYGTEAFWGSVVCPGKPPQNSRVSLPRVPSCHAFCQTPRIKVRRTCEEPHDIAVLIGLIKHRGVNATGLRAIPGIPVLHAQVPARLISAGELLDRLIKDAQRLPIYLGWTLPSCSPGSYGSRGGGGTLIPGGMLWLAVYCLQAATLPSYPISTCHTGRPISLA